MTQSNKRLKSRIFEICVFAMLGSVMFCSKIVMEVIPNVHLLGMLTMAYTLVFRARALIPIYIYVFLNGLYAGFDLWWVPYLYIWAILWGVTMLLPKRMPRKIAAVVYPVVCALHGLLFGILYAPAYVVMMGMNHAQAIAWLATGVGFDIIHLLGNALAGLLILPMRDLLTRLIKGKME